METTTYTIDASTTDEVISYLEKANKVEQITSSLTCPSYAYRVIKEDGSNLFIVMPSNDNKTLLVGIDDIGYAFSYNKVQDFKTFFSSLK